MVEESPAKDADLIFGGGLASFVHYDIGDPDFECQRLDGRNLINEWQVWSRYFSLIYLSICFHQKKIIHDLKLVTLIIKNLDSFILAKMLRHTT